MLLVIYLWIWFKKSFWPGTFSVRTPLLEDFEWNFFMHGTRERDEPGIYFDQGRCDLLNTFFWSACWLYCLSVLQGQRKNPGFSTNKIFILWSKALCATVTLCSSSVFCSFWMNVKGSGFASSSKHEFNQFNLFALICLSHFCILRLYPHQDKDSVLHFFQTD